MFQSSILILTTFEPPIHTFQVFSLNQLIYNPSSSLLSISLHISYLLIYSILLYSTLLYSTLLYSTLLYSTLFYSTLLYSTLLTALLITSYPSFFQLCTSQNKSDLECYYEPLSKCTIQDALSDVDGGKLELLDITHVGDIPRGEEDKYKKKFKSKMHDLFCCHHENIITSYFFLFTVTFCVRFTLLFFYSAAISLLFYCLFEPLCTSVLLQVPTRLSKNK